MTFEQRYMERLGEVGERVPSILKALFIPWVIISLMFVASEDLQKNLRSWLSLVLVAPYLLLMLAIAPAVFAMQIRWLSWPFRKLFSFVMRPRNG